MKKTHILFCLICLVFFVYISSSLSFYKPLWLDEQYSLLFASTRSLGQLFLGNFDVHPGLYYALLKILLGFEASPSVVRLLSGMLPIAVGWFALTKAKLTNKNQSLYVSIISVLSLLNPYFIDFSWQIRMYGVLFCATCLVLFSLSRCLKKKSVRNYLILGALLLMGQSINFVFYFFSFGVVSFIALQNEKNKVQKIGTFAFFSTTQLFLQTSGTLQQFSQLSWIDPLSISRLRKIVLQIIGLGGSDLNSNSESLLVFIILTLIFLLVFKSKNTKYWFYLVGLPLLAIGTVQLGIYLAQFNSLTLDIIPKVTFVIPRSLLVVVVPCCFLLAHDLADLFDFKQLALDKVVAFLALSTLAICWMFLSTHIIKPSSAADSLSSDKKKYILSQLVQCQEHEIVFYPPWAPIETVNESSLYLIQEISNIHDKSLIFEQRVFSDETKKKINETDPYTVYFLKEGIYSTLHSDQEKMQTFLEQHCYQLEDSQLVAVYRC